VSPSLEGRTVIITGAGRGIGREHALFLASHGAQLVINDLGGGSDGTGRDAGPAQQLAEEIVAAGGMAVANDDDVASSDGALRLVDTAIEAFGDLHALVNNAGIIRDRTLFNMTDDDWDVSIRVNLRGTFAPSRAAARYWRDRSKAGREVSGSIVNTSSESGVFANAGQSNYAAAKAGVAALTEVWSSERGPGASTPTGSSRATARGTSTTSPPPPAPRRRRRTRAATPGSCADAMTASGGERAAVWPRLVARHPSVADYQARTEREIPVVRLVPVHQPSAATAPE